MESKYSLAIHFDLFVLSPASLNFERCSLLFQSSLSELASLSMDSVLASLCSEEVEVIETCGVVGKVWAFNSLVFTLMSLGLGFSSDDHHYYQIYNLHYFQSDLLPL